MVSAQRDIEVTFEGESGYSIRVIDPAENSGREAQYGPFPSDAAEEQLIALGVPLEQAAALVLNATRDLRAVLRGAAIQTEEDGNAW